MEIRNLMSKNIVVADIQDSINSVAILMNRYNIGCVPICKEKKIVGVITDRDIVVRAIRENCRLSDEISKYISKKIVSVNVTNDLTEVLNIMKSKKVKRVLVEDEGKVVGILSLSDLLKTDSDPMLIVGALKDIFIIEKNKEDYYL